MLLYNKIKQIPKL